jgi:capsular polysaccharide export protein
MDNCKAIIYASKVAKKNNLALVVKPHPAETDPSEVQRVAELKKQINFYLINGPTINIIKYCDKVITINSTVGLEAMIVGKPVEFIGNTIYKKITTDLLPNYIMSYLIDVDYYGFKSISTAQLKSILDKRL